MIAPTGRVLELFAGIGGLSVAIGSHRVAAAFDISTDAAKVYRANFPTPYHCREIESVSNDEFRQLQADVWWFSAPCQPYTRRGLQRDTQDHRSFAIQRVLKALAACCPTMLGLENVPAFANSHAHQHLTDWLDRVGYHWQAIELCPSQMGWPNRRPRYYLIASQQSLPGWKPLVDLSRSLDSIIIPIEPSSETQHLWVGQSDSIHCLAGLDRVASDSPKPTACFAASYGKTWLHAGSYLETPTGLRRFSPREVARLLGFPEDFRLPNLSDSFQKSDRKLWRLLGNSLSIPCIQYVMHHLL